MKIAIIGTGISGSLVAHRLSTDHDITVFEADDRIGGHTNTIDVALGGRRYSVDTGFIVFNDRTYPNFIALLDELGVASQDSDMSFSVRDERVGLEYNGTTINSLFAQRRNLFRPSFHRMIRDILRFNRTATDVLDPATLDLPLEQYLRLHGYSDEFINHYIIPMGAAIWSAQPKLMGETPTKFFVKFFENHGLLTVNRRPTWKVVAGGSHRYLDKLVAGHRDRIALSTPVERIRRLPDCVEVTARGRAAERFDSVFLACHSDQALKMLADASIDERQILGTIEYQRNDVVLHTDDTLMPKRRLAWAAWNYHILERDEDRVAVTYNMNILQGLDAPAQFCVTLNNPDAIEPSKVIAHIEYDHPVFTPDAVAAQRRYNDVNGINRTYFCGAYWRYGFHEDGVVSAQAALAEFENREQDAERHLRRAG